jgi:hypothetical protein
MKVSTLTARNLHVNGKIVIKIIMKVLRPIEGTGMPRYRVHILDQRGDLKGAVDLNCDDDEAAIERVGSVLDSGHGELWRLVTRFEMDSPSIQIKPS